MAFAAMLIGPKRWRRGATALTVLTGLALALSFIRAIYVGELVGLAIISFHLGKGNHLGGSAYPLRVHFCLLGVVLALALVGGGTTTTANSSSPVQVVAARAALGLTDVETGGGTAGYRLREAHLELGVLGGNWLAGLGFLHPSYRYFAGLPEGAIKNGDLGSLSVLMTMGIIGLILAYIPPVVGLIYLLRRRYGAVQYGGAMYLVAAIVGSITLGAVSTLPGLMVLGSRPRLLYQLDDAHAIGGECCLIVPYRSLGPGHGRDVV